MHKVLGQCAFELGEQAIAFAKGRETEAGAADGFFAEPIGSAWKMPQGSLRKPPARPMVMICVFTLRRGCSGRGWCGEGFADP